MPVQTLPYRRMRLLASGALVTGCDLDCQAVPEQSRLLQRLVGRLSRYHDGTGALVTRAATGLGMLPEPCRLSRSQRLAAVQCPVPLAVTVVIKGPWSPPRLFKLIYTCNLTRKFTGKFLRLNSEIRPRRVTVGCTLKRSNIQVVRALQF